MLQSIGFIKVAFIFLEYGRDVKVNIGNYSVIIIKTLYVLVPETFEIIFL